jgi:hypothetical protein
MVRGAGAGLRRVHRNFVFHSVFELERGGQLAGKPLIPFTDAILAELNLANSSETTSATSSGQTQT